MQEALPGGVSAKPCPQGQVRPAWAVGKGRPHPQGVGAGPSAGRPQERRVRTPGDPLGRRAAEEGAGTPVRTPPNLHGGPETRALAETSDFSPSQNSSVAEVPVTTLCAGHRGG